MKSENNETKNMKTRSKITAFTAVLLLLSSNITFAQNRHIDLKKDQPWQTILEEAREANKYIFFTASAVWCGPCRALENDVYTKDNVADFFNKNFINAKYDMEKGDGIALREKFSVQGYPTLLWIDAKTEEVVHRVVGKLEPADLIAQGNIALKQTGSLREIRKRYEENKTAENLREYIIAMRQAGLTSELTKIVPEFLEGSSKEQLMEEENWKLLAQYVRDPFSDLLQLVFNNRAEFSEVIGVEEVDKLLYNSISTATSRFIRLRDTMPFANFDQEGYDKLMQFAKSIEKPSTVWPVQLLQLLGYAQHEEFEKMILTMREIQSNTSQTKSDRDYYTAWYLNRLVRADRANQERGIALIDELLAPNNSGMQRFSFLQTKSTLLERHGDSVGAAKAKKAYTALFSDTTCRAPVVASPMTPVPPEGGEYPLSLSSDQRSGWAVVVEDAADHPWVTLTNAAGTGREATIMINVAKNPDPTERIAIIRVLMGGTTNMAFLLTQEGAQPIEKESQNTRRGRRNNR
jgi:thiol-disulfide isomerase/thioredoxin